MSGVQRPEQGDAKFLIFQATQVGAICRGGHQKQLLQTLLQLIPQPRSVSASLGPRASWQEKLPSRRT